MVQEELARKDDEQATKDHTGLDFQQQSSAQVLLDLTKAVYNCLQQLLPKY